MKSSRKQADKEEKVILKRVGGRQTPNSGATKFHKGDIHKTPSGHRIESKYTDAASYSLKVDDLNKIAEACSWNETPILIVNFRKSKQRFAIVPYEDYLEMMHSLTS